MMPLEKFYTEDPRWYAKIGDIHALLERVKISIERRLKMLREQGRLRRVGSDKAGHWEVIEVPS